MAALTDEEITRAVLRRTGASSLSALSASVPQYGVLQSTGVEALGDILGADTTRVADFRKAQEEKLQQFNPQHTGRFLESEQKFDWWEEKASLNAMNTVAPMLGFTVGNILKAMPHPVAKGLGSLVNYATFATTYNANLGDTIEEHQRIAGRELTVAEKTKAALVAGGLTYLDTLAPIKGASATSKALAKSFGNGGIGKGSVDEVRRELTKLVKTNRDSLLKQVGTGAKFGAKLVGTEAATEAAQKAIQIGTSVDPSILGTSEGAQDIFEEALIAGPTAGMIGTPGAIGEARSTNRDLSTARRLAKGFNIDQLRKASPTSTETVGGLIDLPEGRGYTPGVQQTFNEGNELLKRFTGVDVKMGAKSLLEGTTLKPLSPIIYDVRNKARTGKEFHAANELFQSFSPTGTGSGEGGITGNFDSVRAVKTGEYLKEVVNTLNKYTNKRLGLGDFGRRLDPNISAYIIARLEHDPTKPETVAALNAAAKNVDAATRAGIDEDAGEKGVIRKALNQAQKDLKESGVPIGFVENYLHRPISSDAVKEDTKGFVKSLMASRARAIREGKLKEHFTAEELSDKAVEKWATAIANDIVNGIDPDIITARELLGKKKEFEGAKRKDFEKSRSAAWEHLDTKYRERSVDKVLTGYLSKAAVRVASATAFGHKAKKLRKNIEALTTKREDGSKAIDQSLVNKIYDVYDAAHHTYKRSETPQEQNWKQASKFASGIGAFTHLGMATLSSIVELAWIGERAGFGHMLATLPKALNYTIKGIYRGASGKHVEPGEGAQALALLGYNLNPDVNERLDQLFSTDRNMLLSGYFRSPLGGFLTQWTNFNRNWAAQAMLSNINHRANGLLRGNISDIEKRRLESELHENGISIDTFNQLTSLARNEEGKVRVDITNDAFLDATITANGKETRVRDVLIPWIHKVVDDVVVTPKATNKPLWMSNPNLALIAQLKTFPIVFGNTVVKRLLRKLNPKQCSPDYGAAIGVVGALAASYALVHLGEILKDVIRDEDHESPDFLETIDRAGLTGAPGMVFGSGKYGDAASSLMGVGFGFVTKAFEDVISPIWTLDEEVSAGDNLVEWLGESLDSSMGAAGIHFKPFGGDE